MLKDRIATILEEKNLRIKDFAESIDVSPNYISMLKSGNKNNLSNRIAGAIEEKYGYSKEWILYGKLPKTIYSDLSKMKQQFIKELSSYNDDEIAAILAFSRTLTDIKSYSYDFTNRNQLPSNISKGDMSDENGNIYEAKKLVPLKGAVAAGHPILALPSYDHVECNNPKADYAVVIKGDSMEPLIKADQIVFCQETPDLHNKDIGIFEIINDTDITEVVCKRYYEEYDMIRLRSLNPKYDDLEFKHDQVRRLGKVLI